MANPPKSTEEYKTLDHSYYDTKREFKDFFVDKRALPEAPFSGINYIFFTAPDIS